MSQKPTPTQKPEGSKSQIFLARDFLLLIAFVEGAAVMAIELGGAKIIAPYYGTSLYVWSSVLAVTLGGLTTGYYVGGWATSKYDPQRLLMLELIVGTALIALMPILGLYVIPWTSGLGIRTGSLISTMIYMMPPLICMGMVSPTIIQLCNRQVKETGQTAGTVYAISTIGGILMTLLMGFYMLSEFGIRASLYLAALPLGIMALLLVLKLGKHKPIALGISLFVGLLIFTTGENFRDPYIPLNFLYKSEGILGQLTVLQNPDPGTGKTFRHLFINHIAQTWVDEEFIPISEWGYPHRIATYASIKPTGSKALMVGLGGGSVAMEFKQLGFKLDIVELDERVPFIAETFFGFEPQGTRIFIDDGRHYFNTTQEKYDLIFVDVLNGEVQPHHMFTLEALEKVKGILNQDGLLIINFQGSIAGPYGKGTRSIYRTLWESGFQTYFFNEGNDGDIHFMASPSQINFKTITEDRINPCCRYIPHEYDDLVSGEKIDIVDAFVLRDDRPVLDLLNTYNNEQWRKTAIGAIIQREKDNGIPFFR
ncbi:fused MFS/spermidine synthase [Algoriphagus sp.]|uniref:fused MFS/spermidine synthase n=1 Tax=Algoriphagus sp. TaxID=1872435 RepID=UPI00391B0D74